MRQTCNFDTKPSTIVNGGQQRARAIIWLNLNVKTIESPDKSTPRFQSDSARIVMAANTFRSFLQAVDPTHLALATNDELDSVLKYFGAESTPDNWKALRMTQIEGCDKSVQVNCFYLDGVPMWLDKATRTGLANSLKMEKEVGRKSSTLWAGVTPYNMDIEQELELLKALELYAIDCFNVTATHRAYVERCSSVDDLRAFAPDSGYADPLRFNISQ